MDPTSTRQNGQGLDSMLMQWAPLLKGVVDRVTPILDSPVIRMPQNFPLSTSATIAAGANNTPLLQSDFSNSFEWPFEIQRMIVSQDPSHTTRDWKIQITDQTFNQPWQKAAVMVATLVQADSLAWNFDFPWVVRPKGGGLQILVTNLDAVNPITVDVNFVGRFLIPR